VAARRGRHPRSGAGSGCHARCSSTADPGRQVAPPLSRRVRDLHRTPSAVGPAVGRGPAGGSRRDAQPRDRGRTGRPARSGDGGGPRHDTGDTAGPVGTRLALPPLDAGAGRHASHPPAAADPDRGDRRGPDPDLARGEPGAGVGHAGLCAPSHHGGAAPGCRRRPQANAVAPGAAGRARRHRVGLPLDTGVGVSAPGGKAAPAPRGAAADGAQPPRRRWYDDVRYEAYGVLVELDGPAYHPDETTPRDKRRDNAAVADGWDVLRYGVDDIVGRPCTVAREIAVVLRRNGWSGQPRRCGRGCNA
jgi:hypothetical protein